MTDAMSTATSVLSATVLAFGVLGAGVAIGNGFVNARAPDRTVTVKGLSEREVEADLAIWSLSFVATGDDLTSVQREIEDDERIIRDFFERGGIAPDAVSVQSLGVEDRLANVYQPGPVRSRFIVRKTLLVRSADVAAIAERSQNASELVRDGVVLSSDHGPWSNQPTFLFTKLTDIKPEMIAEATRNARRAAEQFAADADTEVGDIVHAQQGLFQILARDDAPQLRQPAQRHKTVRVVSTIRFALD
jgi:hypothetical protein